VTWTNPPAPATSVNIQRSVNAGGSWATFTGPSTGLTGTTVNDTSSTAGQNVLYRGLSRLGATVDTIASASSASVTAGFVVKSVTFANSTSGTLGTLNAGDTVTVEFSQPVSNATTTPVDIRTVATGGTTRGAYLAATGTTAATSAIARLATGNSHFSTGTATGDVAWSSGDTVWTWTAQAGVPAITHAANLTVTGFTVGSSGTRVKCGGSNNLLASTVTPTYSGRW
jgi:hypothetical protein